MMQDMKPTQQQTTTYYQDTHPVTEDCFDPRKLITNEGILTQLDYILLLLPFKRFNCNNIINDVYQAFIIITQDAGEETYIHKGCLWRRDEWELLLIYYYQLYDLLFSDLVCSFSIQLRIEGQGQSDPLQGAFVQTNGQCFKLCYYDYLFPYYRYLCFIQSPERGKERNQWTYYD